MSDPVAQGDDVYGDLQRAEALLAVGRLDAAGQLPAGVLGRHPASAAALCLLAVLENKRGDHRAMLRAADAAVAAEPGSDWAHRLRSTALRHRCRPLEAREAALEAVRRHPTEHRRDRDDRLARRQPHHLPLPHARPLTCGLFRGNCSNRGPDSCSFRESAFATQRRHTSEGVRARGLG